MIIPDLTLKGIAYGTHETKLDLRFLLYKGGAASNIKKVQGKIERGELGAPIAERLPLVINFYDGLIADINMGRARATVENRYLYLRLFFSWCDEQDIFITREKIIDIFYSWTKIKEFEIKVLKTATKRTAYRQAVAIAFLISRAVSININLKKNTKLKPRKTTRNPVSREVDKQNLERTFQFGSLLSDISHALTIDAIYGRLPVVINTKEGKTLTEWAGHPMREDLKAFQPGADKYSTKLLSDKRELRHGNKSHQVRYPLINLRIEAELLIFIAQTGMNVSQAQSLPFGNFSFKTVDDDYLAYRVFKKRRQGEAEFVIFKEYRNHFQSYLDWLKKVFPEGTSRLFPFIAQNAIRRLDDIRPCQAIQLRCKKLNIEFISPARLRRTRINWLLRKSRDLNLTADIAQHTKETLITVYEEPHHQVASLEISRFYNLADPAISPPGPGTCVLLNQAPSSIHNAPNQSPKPDCINPAGCLFCEYHRDIDSLDYLWALASFRYLKRLELDQYRPAKGGQWDSPVVAVIERISAKIEYFRDSSEVRNHWTEEANIRIREGRYHPLFDGTIQLVEILP
ncbi:MULTISPECIES: site-specific integrase [unclassified Pseudomonas]|uniref:site-specific integrase n=1 Tax=unclassified Pseudomonas TaxID=196821 RepID=UPI00244C5956|nr:MULTISPECIES: site-specific integrase [unclassified Pseudomonas]MDH0896709.1 site-specific integrase [Pseudomonas sp. GD03875]MDH1066465.1 site-specific integrase [Pseudomonas sp. GD03985]